MTVILGTVCKYLLADSAVTAAVSGRVYQGRFPESEDGRPAIRVAQVSGGLGYRLDGEDGVGTARVQVDVYGDETTSKSVAALVRTRLSAAKGDIGGVTVRSCQLVNAVSMPTAPIDGSDRWPVRVMLEFSVRFDAA
jgi:hypothetical protein